MTPCGCQQGGVRISELRVFVLGMELFLLILFAEQIGMRARIEHDENKLLVVLLPDEEPIGLDVAFPLALAVAVEHMRKVLGWQHAIIREDADSRTQQLHVVAATFAKFHLTFEFAGKLYRVHG